jgi:dipeptidyl aminopeptidase/acylaminoacyl peptidase
MRYIILLAVASIPFTHAAARHITFDDLYSIPRPHSPQISPEGKQVVFVLRTTNWQEEHYESHLWLMRVDGANQRQITSSESSEHSPRWSPDGEYIYFLSSRGGSSQIWRLPLDGGEASEVTSLSSGVHDYELHPDGHSAIVLTRSWPEVRTIADIKEAGERREERPVEAMTFDHLMYRHYNRWDDSTINQLWRVDFETGNAERLVVTEHPVPTAWLGSWDDYAIHPDGNSVAVAVATDSIPAIWPNNNLWMLDMGSQKFRQLTDAPGLEKAPAFSPDGSRLAWLQQARRGYESDQADLIVGDVDGSSPRNLTLDFDRSVGGYFWSHDGGSIWFEAIEHGFVHIYRVDVQTSRIDTILTDAVYSSLSLSPDGGFLMLTMSLADQPYEVYRYDIGSRKLTRLSYFTAPIVEDIDLSPAGEFWFQGFNGDSVHGFLTRPPAYDPDSIYPLALLIHGGPQWCWLGNFNYYGWNTQLMAAQGYIVAQIDPHGSVGYGLEFKEYVSGHWGIGDYRDLMLGVDHLLANYPEIDSTRMAALGRSYGGFMANWICGHTDRFDCLLSVDGDYNQVSAYGTTEELWFPEWEFRGTPYDNPEEYHRASPATYASGFSTPTMVIHGQKDYRVDLSEGLQMFTALQRQGVPSEFVYFPDEGHSIRKLANLRYVYAKQLDWLSRWLK